MRRTPRALLAIAAGAIVLASAIASGALAAESTSESPSLDSRRMERLLNRSSSGDDVDVLKIAPPPQVTAKAWLVLDDLADEPIAGQDATSPRPIASLAKLMTALVVVERIDLDSDIITVPRAVNDLPADASSIGLKAGEKWPARQLFEAMLVHSANDAALTLASDIGAGDIAAFVSFMNDRADALGMTGSDFKSPTGLDAPGRTSTSTPVDMVLLTETALRDPDIRETVDMPGIEVTPPGKGRDTVKLSNRNPLLGTYDGVDGVKTGFTDAAGYMLIVHQVDPDTKGEYIVATFASSTEKTRITDSRALLDWVRPLRTQVTLLDGGEPLGTIDVVGTSRTISVFACDDVRATVRAGQRITERIVTPRAVAPPIAQGDEVGQIIVTVGLVRGTPVPVCSADTVPVESRTDKVRRHAREYRRAWRAGIDEVQDTWTVAKEQLT